MTAVARGDARDAVNVPSHGNPSPPTGCNSPSVIRTDTCSGNVFSNNDSGGAGVVRKADIHVSHPSPGCPPHVTRLDSYSPDVFVNDREAGRIGDTYGGNHFIATGSGNVFVNGT